MQNVDIVTNWNNAVRMELLLLSTSTVYGGTYLEYALDVVKDFLGDCRRVHFAAYAGADLDHYTARVAAALRPLGLSVTGLHATGRPPRDSVNEAEVLFVGGGNSFRLLRAFQRLELLDVVRERARAGQLRYWGSSAGSNLACPTIRTTNDMPIVEPAGLRALGLIPFQLNPHYVDADPGSTHMARRGSSGCSNFSKSTTSPYSVCVKAACCASASTRWSCAEAPPHACFEEATRPRTMRRGAIFRRS